jgi:hypothetical protein
LLGRFQPCPWRTSLCGGECRLARTARGGSRTVHSPSVSRQAAPNGSLVVGRPAGRSPPRTSRAAAPRPRLRRRRSRASQTPVSRATSASAGLARGPMRPGQPCLTPGPAPETSSVPILVGKSSEASCMRSLPRLACAVTVAAAGLAAELRLEFCRPRPRCNTACAGPSPPIW